jgi:formate dehydrogenase subunit delta
MSTSTGERLVYMANQIGTFFRSLGPEKVVPGVSEHIRKFWEPRMRTEILQRLDAGGEGLKPDVKQAIERLKTMA